MKRTLLGRQRSPAFSKKYQTMITFTCAGCGRSFTVPDQYAGRRATCKGCGAPVEVPAFAHAGAAADAPGPAAVDVAAPVTDGAATRASGRPTAPRIPMRVRRLNSDAQQMEVAFADFPPIRVVSTRGTPAEVYQIEYHVKSLERGPGKKLEPIPREQHLVEIQLTADYPRVSPQCRMLTPVFHPNIDPSHVCVGDHWAAGERLPDLVVRIGEMLAFQAYNIKSPLDAEAAMWADLHQSELPTDPRPMRPPGME